MVNVLIMSINVMVFHIVVTVLMKIFVHPFVMVSIARKTENVFLNRGYATALQTVTTTATRKTAVTINIY